MIKKVIIGLFWSMILLVYHGFQWLIFPMRFLSLQVYNRMDNFLLFVLSGLIVWWCQVVIGLKIVFHDDEKFNDFEMHDNQLVISNHVSYTDWFSMFFVSYHCKSGKSNGLLRWIVKASVFKLPILGWCMKLRNFIGLERKASVDLSNLDSGIKLYFQKRLPTWLTIYPEGTFLDGTGNYLKVVESSNEVCKKSSTAPPMTHVLAPRYKGLYTIINSIDKCHAHRTHDKEDKYKFQNLLNLTMTFSGNGYDTAKSLALPLRKIPGGLDLLTGDGPKEIHIHRQLIQLDTIPRRNEDEFKTWLFEKWQEKNQLLINFEKQHNFTGKISHPIMQIWSWQIFVFTGILLTTSLFISKCI